MTSLFASQLEVRFRVVIWEVLSAVPGAGDSSPWEPVKGGAQQLRSPFALSLRHSAQQIKGGEVCLAHTVEVPVLAWSAAPRQDSMAEGMVEESCSQHGGQEAESRGGGRRELNPSKHAPTDPPLLTGSCPLITSQL